MKRRFVQRNGELVEVTQGYTREPAGPFVMPDINPYISMADGSLITSRSKHREHLRVHNCQEVGNDPSVLNPKPRGIPDAAPQQRHELIRSQVDAMTHREFRAAIKRDVDRVKWQSNDN